VLRVVLRAGFLCVLTLLMAGLLMVAQWVIEVRAEVSAGGISTQCLAGACVEIMPTEVTVFWSG
jgi:hypothetical protein